MKKIIALLLITGCFSFIAADAQVIVRPGMGYRRYPRPPRRKKTDRNTFNKFEPSVNLSVGYGFPNVDKDQLVTFPNFYKGNYSQTGPITGSLDYRFSPGMSIGVMVTHGKVDVPYYDYTGAKALQGSLDNWAFMLNIVRYISLPNSKVSPYFRTAIGVNTWEQDYTEPAGTKLLNVEKPSDLAYQVGLGASFKLSKNAGVFIEAGYGKYILQGGLSFKF